MNHPIKARPTVTGPITGGNKGWPFAASTLDVAAYGYTEAEYLLEGTATRYRLAPGAQLTRDGHWKAEPAGTAPFRTRLLVYRPKDGARFNGTVVLTWNNVTAGHDLFGAESLELFEGGYALACLTTQKVGIDGLPPVRQGLATWDPQRYGTLSIPSDDYSYDIFTQGALALGKHRKPQGVDPMAGLAVERIVAQGASQSAGRLGTYVNAIQPLTNAFDGFILAIYFGTGSPLEVGDAVVNINAAPTMRASDRLRGGNLLRDDLGVPVFVVNSELEAIACYGVRQPDSDYVPLLGIGRHVPRVRADHARTAGQADSRRPHPDSHCRGHQSHSDAAALRSGVQPHAALVDRRYTAAGAAEGGVRRRTGAGGSRRTRHCERRHPVAASRCAARTKQRDSARGRRVRVPARFMSSVRGGKTARAVWRQEGVPREVHGGGATRGDGGRVVAARCARVGR